MAFYEYKCMCGYEFSLRRSMSACKEPAVCPECAKLVNRKVSLFNHTGEWTLSEASHIRGNPDELVRRE